MTTLTPVEIEEIIQRIYEREGLRLKKEAIEEAVEHWSEPQNCKYCQHTQYSHQRNYCQFIDCDCKGFE